MVHKPDETAIILFLCHIMGISKLKLKGRPILESVEGNVTYQYVQLKFKKALIVVPVLG